MSNATRMTGLRLVLAAGLAASLASGALAQPKPPPAPPPSAPPPTKLPGAVVSDETDAGTTSPRTTLLKLSKRITLEVTETRLEDVMNYIKESTGAEIEPMWGEGGENGLNKDLPITMSVKNMPALDVIERLLAKAQTEFSENTWQLTQNGAIEMGPKEMLNKHKRLEMYDINDLLFQIPNYTDVPEIDLQGLLQQSQGGGGGGGQSPFRDDQQNQKRTPEQEKQRRKDAAQEILDLIIALVEPQQWVDNGGEAATIKYYQGNIVVYAPDYVHRQLNGYKFWPSYSTKVISNRRYVSLDMDSGIGTIDKIRNFPVTGVAGGGAPGGGGGGGGGGQPPPRPVLPPG